EAGLTLHTAGDVDYSTFVAGSKGAFAVSITPTQGSGTLSLTVLNASQAVLASGQSQTGVTLSLNLASGTQYYIKVSSPTGSLFGYDLSLAPASGGGGASGAKGGHHLTALGVENPDAEAEGDVFYQNAADDPDYAGLVPRGPVSSSFPAQTGAAALAP